MKLQQVLLSRSICFLFCLSLYTQTGTDCQMIDSYNLTITTQGYLPFGCSRTCDFQLIRVTDVERIIVLAEEKPIPVTE